MALSRDTRMDRRRRVLLDASSAEQAEGTRKNNTVSQTGESGGKKGAGYSQDVRQACGTRLVQLIPVRRRSFIALIVASIAITACLLTAHYLVYVNGWLPWYGHPLAVALDATHPQSIATWLGSHLWLLCLGATILTFQLRRHKLDDYNGEYRLWFWLVFTCVIANFDSTTHITELFGYSLDRWSRANIGWSGQAVVLATLATLVGMLGLRLCTELKTVPLSLICWLIGMACWAGSSVLAQQMFRIDLTIQTRPLLRAGLWLFGQTFIWIAAVAYLRHVYMEAQRRFLARGLLARRTAGVSLTERVRQTIPFMRTRQDGDAEVLEGGTEASRWSLKRMFRRKPKEDGTAAETSKADRKAKAKPTSAPSKPVETSKPQEVSRPQTLEAQRSEQTARPQTAAPLAAQIRPQVSSANAANTSGATAQAATGTSATANKTAPAPSTSTATTDAPKKSSLWPFKFKLWPGKEVGEEDAPEYQKLLKEEKAAERKRLEEERQLQKENARAEKAAAKQARTAQREADKSAKREARQKQNTDGTEKKKGSVGKTLLKPLAAVGGALKKMKLPSLSAFKLNPPDSDADATESKPSTLKPVSQEKPLPSTNKPGTGPQLSQRNVQNQQDEYEDDEDDRNMSRADRKKLRKQNRAA